jgi:CO/xanthine dehydrogenase Mo-binding subunit
MLRLEGLAKLTGAERYIDDEPPPAPHKGCLWGMTVRSPAPHARGRIKGLKFDPGIDWSGFVIVDSRDIPGPNETYLIENDQPVLAALGGETRHMHEAVALIAGEDREAVRRAVAAVTVEVEPLPAVLDYRVRPRPNQMQRGADNVIKELRIEKGDVEAALRGEGVVVVEGEYETGAQEHVYIENQGMMAWIEPAPHGRDGDVVVVKGSMQCPYYVLNALKHALGRDESRVRVIQAPTGGGFGGKEDYPSTIALHAALLALKARRPVKIIYDRGEDMAATTKRHPSRVRHRTAVSRDGKLLAQDIEVLLDGGAYVTLSPVVLSRGIIHAGGPYFCPNVRIVGRAMLTNHVPYGAFRGFGAPQTQFALERHMDEIAARLGIDSIELRRRNLLRDGETTSTGQVTKGGTDRVAMLDRAVALGQIEQRRREHEHFNATHPFLRRGVGVSFVYHGAGFTGNGEVYLKSRLEVQGLPDGRVEVLAASTEMGQGTTTIFTQIAAAALGYEERDIVVAVPDTSRVPNSGPTVASRTAMVVGGLIEQACAELRSQLGLPEQARGPVVKDAIVRWHRVHPGARLRAGAGYTPPPDVVWDDKAYKGDAYATFSYGACVAEVEVDLRTAGVRVVDFVTVNDIGRVINPTLARGQVQGGVVQAIGWALMEECRFKDGGMINNQLTNYIIPTSDDVPPIRVEFVDSPPPQPPPPPASQTRPPPPQARRGIKGVGELPMDGPAPAILNAVATAVGVSPRELPLTPERLLALLPQEQFA